MDALANALTFPSSALLAAVFMLSVFAVYHYAHEAQWIQVLSSTKMALVLLAIGALLLAVEGTWSVPVHRSLVFLVYVLTLLLSLGLALLDGIRHKRKLGFVLNHLGILIILWASLFGSPDVQKLKLIVGKGQTEQLAYTADGMVVMLPFEVTLEEFWIDYYEDAMSPKQFTSSLVVGGEKMQTSVNHPCSFAGYSIYQDSYDPMEQRYTILQLVRDPWLPLVYVGMLLLVMGSAFLLYGKWKAKVTIPVTLVLTVLFTCLTVAKINLGTMMPALRSWWFVPHIFIYMVAYSLMAMALLATLFMRYIKEEKLVDGLMRSSCALLIIGMLTGSVWARQAWGDYWAWDPKENWAAVTWFLSLGYLHLADCRGVKALAVILLAFLALQITWYGVNYLPSAAASLHTYTQ